MIGIEDNFLKKTECENLIRIFSDWSIKMIKHRDIHALHLYEIEMDLSDKKFCWKICSNLSPKPICALIILLRNFVDF